jgi:hypothetical protein
MFGNPLDNNLAAAKAAPPARRCDTVSAAVLVLPERCYRCGRLTQSIVGLLVPTALTDDPDGFVDFETIAPLIAASLSNARLARHGIGPLRMRRSRYRPDRYLSNGCIHCDAIQGSFPLHEDLMEFLSEGGDHKDLIATHCSLRGDDVTARLAASMTDLSGVSLHGSALVAPTGSPSSRVGAAARRGPEWLCDAGCCPARVPNQGPRSRRARSQTALATSPG